MGSRTGKVPLGYREQPSTGFLGAHMVAYNHNQGGGGTKTKDYRLNFFFFVMVDHLPNVVCCTHLCLFFRP
jgi:hypothetical protein